MELDEQPILFAYLLIVEKVPSFVKADDAFRTRSEMVPDTLRKKYLR